MDSNKKVAIITGASRGIGKACALGLANLGYHCILISRNQENLEKVAEEIETNKGTSSIFTLDITKSDEIKTCIEKIKLHYPSIDVLVNNAGIYHSGSTSLSEENFKAMIDTNLTAQFNILKEVVPIMKDQKSGYIFNVASRAGKIGFAESGGYCASKFGLVGLNESLYRELAAHGISVTAICPGWVDTKMAIQAGTTIEGKDMIQPEDISKTLEYLLGLSPGTRIKEVVIESAKSIS